jgi:molybdopterin converting factor small subunit
MVVIRLIYVGVFAELTNRDREEIFLEEEGVSLTQLLQTLAEKYGEKFRKELFSGNRSQQTLVMLNGVRIDPQAMDKIRLKDGDILVISPILPLGG